MTHSPTSCSEAAFTRPVPYPPEEVIGAPGRGGRVRNEVREFVEERRLRGELGQTTADHAIRDLVRFPSALRRCGVTEPPFCASGFRPAHVIAYKEAPWWELTTKRPVLAHLRAYLRWGGNEIANETSLWRIPRGRPVRRYWITREQLAELYDQSTARTRLHLAAQGFNGLRECELLRLRWSDVSMAPPVPTIRVLGKGRGGGKPRTVPLTPTFAAVLGSWESGSERVYPVGHSVAHGELAALGKKAGLPFPLSGHVLRRSMGRIAYQAGVPLVDIRNLYGHESVEMTAYYIGVDEEAMAAGVLRFDSFVRGQGAL